MENIISIVLILLGYTILVWLAGFVAGKNATLKRVLELLKESFPNIKVK